MKIVVVGTRGIPNILGGVETHCEELFPRIAAKGIEVTVVRRQSYVRDSLMEFKGVKLLDIATPRRKSLEAIVHTFRAIWMARKLHADIVHIHAIGPALLTPFARLLGLKVEFTHHGPDYDRDKWGRMAKWGLKLGERMGCYFANEVIVISEVINDLIIRKYNCCNAHLIHNGVPIPDIVEDTFYLDELGIEKGNYILTMGRFVPEKNFHQLVHAYSAISRNSCRLVIAGGADFEDDYSRNFKRLAKENGVVLTGFIKGKRLHSLLTHAKCFVLPSSHEGLPIALLEAMSYRLPVLVSNIPANLEIGLNYDSYFKVGDERQLTEKLRKMIQGELRRIDYPMEEYDWDRIASQVIHVYNRLR